MNNIDYQSLVNQLADFIERRFGVYLDTISGFQYNLNNFERTQQQVAQRNKLSIEELDKALLIRANAPPSSDLEECISREIHRMTQSTFKKHNSPGGMNYDFAIENCLSDIFNYWNALREKFNFLKDISNAFPVMEYMKKLRHRVQHDLYEQRMSTEKKGPITLEKTFTSYTFPTFEVGESISFSTQDIEALVLEVRVQLKLHLIPYINNLLKKQVPTPP